MTATTREVYGLAVSSDRDLFPHSPPTRLPVDVEVRFAPDDVAPRLRGAGRLLLTFAHGRADYFCERLDDGSYVLAFVGSCECLVSADLSQVDVHRYPGAVEGIENVLAAGALIALLLYLRGVPVLHASAVQHDDRVIGFVGASGQGKSTMATLLCAAGDRVITDDLLRVDLDGEAPRARLGSPDLRLRKGADVLAASFVVRAPERRATADDRQVIRPRALGDDGRRLAALYLPIPDRDTSEVRIDRVRPTDAVYLLLNSPRLLGWVDPGLRGAQFTDLARIAASVPVSVARVPWGPPFLPGIAESIVADLDSHRAVRSLDDIMAGAE